MASDNSEAFEPRTNAQPPLEDVPAQITTPSKVAGGLPAIKSTFQYVVRNMGLVQGSKTLLKVNQKDGFDCPGCAWPDPQRRTITEFCENGAKAVTDEATTKRVDSAFFQQNSISHLLKQSDQFLNAQGRLSEPMYRAPGSDHYTSITWEKAFQLVADTLNALPSPDEAIFYTSGRTSNEAAFLYQLFVRQYGTNNLPDCSNMCHESSGRGLGETIGIGKGTVTLEDFDHADLIMVIGQNPGTNHPRMLTTLQECARRGAQIISINPLRETGLSRFIHPQELTQLLGSGTPLAEHFVPVRIGGDVALLKGIMKQLLVLEEEQPGKVLDQDFITKHTVGFEAFKSDLAETSWEEVISGSGIPKAQILNLAAMVANSKNMICCWAMGLTQHKNAVGNIQAVVNLLLMGGHMGRPGAGACPVRGHSNVQGDRTMGIWERPTDAFLNALAKRFSFEPPREHGFDAVAAIEAMYSKRASVFFAMGGNFLSAAPDTEYTAKALQNCDLSVQVSTKLNRSHLITGRAALILPCLGRTEIDEQKGNAQFVSVENSMGVVHSSQGFLAPASPHLHSEPSIVANLAHRVLNERSTVPWMQLLEDYDQIRDLIADTIPGHHDYNLRVKKPGGFILRNSAREREFNTASGKAQFTVHDIPDLHLEANQVLMMTIRSHDQYNTTIYDRHDRYRGIKGGRRVVLLNKKTIKDLALTAGSWVDLISHYQGKQRLAERFMIVEYDIPDRCAATYFPESNVLVPVNSFAKKSRTPTSKAVVISFRAT